MPRVTSEQIRAAKEVDLLTYLQANEPGDILKRHPGEYRTVSHDSLVISKGLWYWNHGKIGGRSAVDYLIKVRGMDFVDAVLTVLDGRAAIGFSSLPVERSKPPPVKKAFVLPPATKFPNKAVAYLQDRGIHADVIRRCLDAGLLYESSHEGKPVCVFVGKDDEGVARFAHMRGIGTDVKRDVFGSDKRIGFTLPAENPANTSLAVFEAPVDLLSHATLVHRGDLAFDGHRLSLGGAADVALVAYLEREPHIRLVTLCLDDDAAGWTAVEKICGSLSADSRFAGIEIKVDPPTGGKDYNEMLQHLILQAKHERSGVNRDAAPSL